AGPRSTAPVQTLNCERCHGQVTVMPSSVPWLSGPPACVHLACVAQKFPSTLNTAASPTSAADPCGTSLTLNSLSLSLDGSMVLMMTSQMLSIGRLDESLPRVADAAQVLAARLAGAFELEACTAKCF